MCHVKVCTCLRWCYSMCLYTCVIHSLLLVMPVYMLQCIAVLLGVMIYAGGKNNVIPHTTGLTSPLLFCSSSCAFAPFIILCAMIPCTTGLTSPLLCVPLLTYLILIHYICPFILCDEVPMQLHSTGLTSPRPLFVYLSITYYSNYVNPGLR